MGLYLLLRFSKYPSFSSGLRLIFLQALLHLLCICIIAVELYFVNTLFVYF